MLYCIYINIDTPNYIHRYVVRYINATFTYNLQAILSLNRDLGSASK